MVNTFSPKLLLNPESCFRHLGKAGSPGAMGLGKRWANRREWDFSGAFAMQYDSDGDASLPPPPHLKHQIVPRSCSCQLKFLLFPGDVVHSTLCSRNGCPVLRQIKWDQRWGKAYCPPWHYHGTEVRHSSLLLTWALTIASLSAEVPMVFKHSETLWLKCWNKLKTNSFQGQNKFPS